MPSKKPLGKHKDTSRPSGRPDIDSMGGETETPDSADTLRTSIGSVVVAGLVLAGIILAWAGWRAAISVAAGASLGASSLWALGRIARGLVDPSSPKAAWIAAGVAKLIVELGALYLLIESGFADILPLALGLTTLPLGIVIAQMLSSRHSRG